MGRELKRVPLDFNWPQNKPYEGFVNPYYTAIECKHCGGSGYSAYANQLRDLWYGRAAFRPEDRGSVAFRHYDAPVRAFAERNVKNAPEHYRYGEYTIVREAVRLAKIFNNRWQHHLNDADVATLVAEGRLMDFTHTWTNENGWQEKFPPYVPSAKEVNDWSVSGVRHGGISQTILISAECARFNMPLNCSRCAGEGHIWPSDEAKIAYEIWEPTEPPTGEGYQIWETVSEGSPISPVFATALELAEHMTWTSWGCDTGTSVETWLKFIEGPGWAPTMVMAGNEVIDGVKAIVTFSETVV